jgi:hypothetical protein
VSDVEGDVFVSVGAGGSDSLYDAAALPVGHPHSQLEGNYPFWVAKGAGRRSDQGQEQSHAYSVVGLRGRINSAKGL